MNPLSKLQALMAAFLLLTLSAFVLDLLLLIPAALVFLLQFPVSRRELKRDYPEDWARYLAIFVAYEVLLLAIFYVTATASLSLTDFSSVYGIFGLLLSVIIATIVLRAAVLRKHCYGTVLFTSGEWAGVSVKAGLFSKVGEADYAVKNPLGKDVRKGDRVKVRVSRGLGSSSPKGIVEVVS